MLVKVETPPRDLNPTSAITQLLSLLRDMLSTASMNEGREKDMGKVNHYLHFSCLSFNYYFFADCTMYSRSSFASSK